jgi:hypothetical protein
MQVRPCIHVPLVTSFVAEIVIKGPEQFGYMINAIREER